jgi:hypothetical protein
MTDQLDLFATAKPATDPHGELLAIMRRKGPCRRVALVTEPMSDEAWDSFDDLVKAGDIIIVGEVRYPGVVPAEHVENVYAAKEAA